MIRPEKAFEFSSLAEKSVSNLAMTFFFFFFWRSPVFGLKKRLNLVNVALTQITQDDCLLQRGSIRMTKRAAIRYVAQ